MSSYLEQYGWPKINNKMNRMLHTELFFPDRKHFQDHNGILTPNLDVVVHKVRGASWEKLVIMINER